MNLVSLGSICSQEKKSIRPGESAHLKYIGLESIESNTGQFYTGELSKTPESPVANSYWFNQKHILYSKLRPYLNKVVIPEFEGKCSTELIPLRPVDGVIKAYIYYFLRSQHVVNLINAKSGGARMPRANMEHVLSLELPLPDLEGQNKIVDALTSADNIINLYKKKLALTCELVNSIFFETSRDSGSFTEVCLGDVCDINPRLLKSEKPDLEQDVSFVPMAAVDEYMGKISKPEVVRYKDVSKGFTYFSNGDVVFAKITPCMENGKVAIASNLVNEIGYGSTEFHVLRPSEVIDRRWLFALLRTKQLRNQAKLAFTGTAGQQRVPADFLKELVIKLPPLELQLKFSLELENIFTLQDELQKTILKSEEFLNSLTHKFFPI